MTDVNIVAERLGSVYRLLVDLGEYTPSLKWDSGVAHTVISAGALRKGLSAEQVQVLIKLCENHEHSEKTEFISASGDPFYGYKVTAYNAVVGETELNRFYYYIVPENKRDIALLGFDFINNCKRAADPHQNIIITEFDDEEYGKEPVGMTNGELIAFIDSLTEE